MDYAVTRARRRYYITTGPRVSVSNIAESGFRHTQCGGELGIASFSPLGHHKGQNRPLGPSLGLETSDNHHDRPPLKWSDLRYVFDIQEDCNGKEAIQEIVAKLRQGDVLVSQGQNMVDAIRQIG